MFYYIVENRILIILQLQRQPTLKRNIDGKTVIFLSQNSAIAQLLA